MSELKREEEYRMIEIPGKHGKIKLMVPMRGATDDEMKNLHRVVAQTIINTMNNTRKVNALELS